MNANKEPGASRESAHVAGVWRSWCEAKSASSAVEVSVRVHSRPFVVNFLVFGVARPVLIGVNLRLRFSPGLLAIRLVGR